MASDIITFEKSAEERLCEFTDILCSREKPIRASQVFYEWRCYLELVLEPISWQALWKISRVECEKRCIKFPTVVFVEVLNVDFSILYATITTIAVQDNIEIPAVNKVPLQQLFPTTLQENDVLDVEGTANCLDQLRFFYDNIWYPWDIDDDAEDWSKAHLESRLQLYYDIRTGIVARETGEHIHNLLKEAKKIHLQVSNLQNETDQSENDTEDMEDNITSNLVELELRKQHIKFEMKMLENPVMRNIIIKKQELKAAEKRVHGNGHSGEVCFVWIGGPIDQFVKSIANVKKNVDPTAFFKSMTSAQGALDQAVPEDTVILCPGTHHVHSVGGLEAGGSLQGLSTPFATTLTPLNVDSVLLDISARDKELKLENLTIDAFSVQTALLVRSSELRMNNCRVVGNGESRSQQGVLVLEGGTFVADNCEFIQLGCAVVVDNGGEARLTNCRVTNCFDAFQLTDEAILNLNQCSVTGCKVNGIRIETYSETPQMETSIVGSLMLLEGRSTIIVKDSLIENNSKGDVIMISKNHNMRAFDEDE